MKRVPTLLLALLVLSCSRADAQHPSTVVLELFTSQGCSSCPPADKLLSTLRRESFPRGRVIPLAYHVDYWNHLGWQDPFSSRQWSTRQNEYARVRNTTQVYTPQVVIDGREQMVGSAEGAIRREIERQFDAGDRGAIVIERITKTADTWIVDVRSRIDANLHANVVAVLFENGVTTAIKAGENENVTLTNDAIVRWESRGDAARTTESKSRITIPIDKHWNATHLGVAVFLQDPRSLTIYVADSTS